ncbi:hypothetical protein G195_003565 [Phytophthora kernoviae 00238/432]|uniref:Uncharacterized protein n=1 Tax=Phytophthora kernoviae 00238/432 TaxID=1284355 RepID=A0A8J4SER8_9STRA|nr:hypothetical protein G195_003565 [Phytophthora kernoviae 00238/432]
MNLNKIVAYLAIVSMAVASIAEASAPVNVPVSSTGTWGQSTQTTQNQQQQGQSSGTWGQSTETSTEQQQQQGQSTTTVSGSVGVDITTQGGESAETPCSGNQSSTGTWGQSTQTTQNQQQQGQSSGTWGQSTETSTEQQQQQGQSTTTVSGSVGVDITTQGGESAETPCSGDQSATGTSTGVSTKTASSTSSGTSSADSYTESTTQQSAIQSRRALRH